MRISDWSSDVCSSDLGRDAVADSALPAADRGTGPRARQHRRSVRNRGGWPGIARPGLRFLRSEERRVGKEWSVRVDLGGRRIIKKKKKKIVKRDSLNDEKIKKLIYSDTTKK